MDYREYKRNIRLSLLFDIELKKYILATHNHLEHINKNSHYELLERISDKTLKVVYEKGFDIYTVLIADFDRNGKCLSITYNERVYADLMFIDEIFSSESIHPFLIEYTKDILGLEEGKIINLDNYVGRIL